MLYMYNELQAKPIRPWNMYDLLTKCEVKMAGYMAKFFFLASLWTEAESRWSIKLQKKKKNEGTITLSLRIYY